jgi:hypothetical protein
MVELMGPPIASPLGREKAVFVREMADLAIF